MCKLYVSNMNVIDYINNYLKNGTYKGLVSKFTRVNNNNLRYELDEYLINMGFDLDVFDKTSQKLYHVINNKKEIPKCYCGNLLLYKNLSLGYLTYCSTRCQASSDTSREKSRKTSMNRYGYIHHSKRPEEIKRVSDRHKEEPFGFFSDSYKKTIMDKYGVDNISKHKDIRNKKRKYWEDMDIEYKSEFIKDRSNKSVTARRSKFKEKMIKEMNEMNVEFLESCKYKTSNGIECYGNYKMRCNNCGSDFEILKCSLYNRISNCRTLCTKCNPTNIFNSNIENDVSDYIKSFYNGNIILNERHILNGKELDIYLPDLNLAFEFNGLYWHSELYKDNNYHLNKTKQCLEKNIQLVHIYEDDWINKQDIVKSIILNLIDNTSLKLYARKCTIKEITDNKLVRRFLEDNHIHGFIGRQS